jgi:hypothetical protein
MHTKPAGIISPFDIGGGQRLERAQAAFGSWSQSVQSSGFGVPSHIAAPQ